MRSYFSSKAYSLDENFFSCIKNTSLIIILLLFVEGFLAFFKFIGSAALLWYFFIADEESRANS